MSADPDESDHSESDHSESDHSESDHSESDHSESDHSESTEISALIQESGQLNRADEPWSLRRLERLDPHEHDYQEFKSSEWLAQDDTLSSDLFHVLSKQVSAFANGGGGALIIGVRDDGSVDQGVLTQLKGGTREWLEDVIDRVVSPRLSSFNVFEIPLRNLPKADPRPRAVYVIEIPQSSEAPHQARDHRYYLRVAGKSRPMSHLHLEDVLRRNNRPRVELARLGPYGEMESDLSEAGEPQAFVMLRAFIHNRGRVMARHIGAELTLPRVFISREVRERMRALGDIHYNQRPGEVSFFRYHPTPLFPTQEVYALCVWLLITEETLNALNNDAQITWAVYADDAAPITGSEPLSSFANVRQAAEWIESYLGFGGG